MGAPFAVEPLIDEWSFEFDPVVVLVATAVDGRYCFSVDGRFSLSLLVDGRVLAETTFDVKDDCVFEASVTPLLVDDCPLELSVPSV